MRAKLFFDAVQKVRGKKAADRLRRDVRALIKGERNASLF